MKAVCFMTYYASMQAKHLALYPTLQDYKEFERKTRAYWELLNQPFAPEMILSVFEGWELVDKITPRYENIHKNNIRTSHSLLSGHERRLVMYEFDRCIWESTKAWIPFPATLNDFISDCTRAGIELQFKGEIAKTLV